MLQSTLRVLTLRAMSLYRNSACNPCKLF
jgi:hypothetical protein